MLDRPHRNAKAIALIVVCMLGATVIEFALPGSYVASSLYAIPVLLAARRLSDRGAAVTAGAALALILVADLSQGTPTSVVAAGAFGLSGVGALGVQVARQRARGQRRAREAEEARERIARTLESITDGFFALDREWRFTYINRQAERIMRRSREELLGKNIWKLYPAPVDLPLRAEAERAVREQVPVHFEAYSPTPAAWYEAHLYPSADGVSVYFRDVTARRKAEDAQRETEAKYRTLIEQIPAVTYITALTEPGSVAGTGYAMFVSPQIEAILGYSPAEWTARTTTWAERLHPDDRERVLAENARANATGEPFRAEYRLLARDGRIVWVREEGVLVRDALGQPRSWQGMMFDVTAQKVAEAERADAAWRSAFLAETSRRLAASEIDYAAIPQQIADLVVPELADWCAVYLVHEDRRVRVAGLARAGEAGADLTSWFEHVPKGWAPASDARRTLEAGHTIYLSTPVDVEEVLSGARGSSGSGSDGVDLDSAVLTPLIARGNMLGILLCARRIGTASYAVADVGFVEEVARRCALVVDNARLYREAQDALKAREDFLSVASHELRTPLTSIKGYTQLLARRLTHQAHDVERLRETMRKLQPHLTHLERVVHDLLDISRFQQERLAIRLEPCDLVEIGREVFDGLRASEEHDPAQPMRFKAPESLPGIWDSVRIAQVIANLMSNALRYSDGRGPVVLRLDGDDDEAVVIVTDQGIGLSLSEQRRVFEPFYRGDTVSGRVPGSGLGLYITKQIVEAHGGSITVESEPGVGSTFTVRLPRRPLIASTDDMTPEIETGSGPKRQPVA